MPQSRVRIFLACPGDVAAERMRVREIIDAANEKGGIANKLGLILELVRWESDAAPGMGRPESVILNQVKPESWDIFIGIIWCRFGTPTTPATVEGERYFESGTEEEFEAAYSAWQSQGRPHIMIYRCLAPVSLDLIEGAQLQRIERFFARFSPTGDAPGLYHQFATWEKFAHRLTRDLDLVLTSRFPPPEDRRSLEPGTKSQATGADSSLPLERLFEKGQAYQVAFLSIDIVRHSAIVKGAQASLSQHLAVSFHSFVSQLCHQGEGATFSWAGDGGVLVFSGERHAERALITGLKILNNLSTFNLDRSLNPTGYEVKVRAAVHAGTLIYQWPPQTIASADLNTAVHIQESIAGENELCATDSVLCAVDERLSDLFHFKGRFEGIPVHATRLQAGAEIVSLAEIEGIVEECAELAADLRGICLQPRGIGRNDVEILSQCLEGFYTRVNRFCGWFSRVDARWSQEFLASSSGAARRLHSLEGEAWETLRLRGTTLQLSEEDEDIEPILLTNSSRRSRPVVFLERLVARLEESVSRAVQGIDQQRLRALLLVRLKNLEKADDLDLEKAMLDLLLNQKEDLIAYLQEQGGAAGGSLAVNALWRGGDLVIQEHCGLLYGHQRAHEPSALDVLSEGPSCDKRFATVKTILGAALGSGDMALSGELLRSVFAFPGTDSEMIWRCLAVGHSDERIQKHAIETVGLASVWQLVARSRVPLRLLCLAGERLARRENDELQKIFFDCTRGYVLEMLASRAGQEEVVQLVRIIMLMARFDFVVETTYFERFDEVVSKFAEAARSFGLKVDYFDGLRAQVEEKRKERGSPQGAGPQSVRDLPLSIQRRLAGDANYLMLFVSHPDPRVALETIRHINVSNIESLVRMPDINSHLLRELLKKSEYFLRSRTVVAALCNPKCTQEFAAKALSVLQRVPNGRSAVSAVATSRSANAFVKSRARQVLASLQGQVKR